MTRKTTNAIEILNRRHPPTVEDRSQRAAFRGQLEIAEMIFEARTEAGLSQRELAELVGTSPSVICRLEDADYEGHSMAMLRRVAEALGKQVVVQFVKRHDELESA